MLSAPGSGSLIQSFDGKVRARGWFDRPPSEDRGTGYFFVARLCVLRRGF
jgi:hypothetical protein